MSGPITHRAILRRYRAGIAVTLLLLAAENVLNVLEPYLLGRAIDGLIAGSYSGLFVFLGLAGAALAIGIARRMYDTRLYGRIYREAAVETIERENAGNASVAQMSARAGFVQEFTDFFEIYFPAALMSGFTLAGSVVMLGVISFRLLAATLLAGLLAGLVFYFSRTRIRSLNASLNDEMEKQVDVLTSRDSAQTRRHFSSIVSWRILLSDLEARNFGAVFAYTILLTALAAYILIAVEDATEGEVFAALTYVLQFSQAVIVLPYTYQQFIRTSEISARLAAGGGTAPAHLQ